MLTLDDVQKNIADAHALHKKIEALTDAEKDVVLALIEGIRLGANIAKKETA